MEMMKMLFQMGEKEAALELGRMILQRSTDRDMLRDLVHMRNHRASIGMIDLRIVEPEQ